MMPPKFLKLFIAFALAIAPAPGKLEADGKEIIPTELLQDDLITEAKVADNALQPEHRNLGDFASFLDDFFGPAVDETNAWVLNDTSAAGAPTHAILADEHAVELKLTNNDQVEVCGYDFNDKLVFDIDLLKKFIARFKVSTITTAEEVVIGMCAAWNDTLNSNVAHAWFKLAATMDLLAESDDGTNDNDDKDTAVNLTADTYIWVMIDFSTKADVKFYTSTDGKTWTQRLSATLFDMSNYTAGLQPCFAILKASGVTQPALTADIIAIVAGR